MSHLYIRPRACRFSPRSYRPRGHSLVDLWPGLDLFGIYYGHIISIWPPPVVWGSCHQQSQVVSHPSACHRDLLSRASLCTRGSWSRTFSPSLYALRNVSKWIRTNLGSGRASGPDKLELRLSAPWVAQGGWLQPPYATHPSFKFAQGIPETKKYVGTFKSFHASTHTKIGPWGGAAKVTSKVGEPT
jgi:hypothetical protein